MYISSSVFISLRTADVFTVVASLPPTGETKAKKKDALSGYVFTQYPDTKNWVRRDLYCYTVYSFVKW